MRKANKGRKDPVRHGLGAIVAVTAVAVLISIPGGSALVGDNGSRVRDHEVDCPAGSLALISATSFSIAAVAYTRDGGIIDCVVEGGGGGAGGDPNTCNSDVHVSLSVPTQQENDEDSIVWVPRTPDSGESPGAPITPPDCIIEPQQTCYVGAASITREKDTDVVTATAVDAACTIRGEQTMAGKMDYFYDEGNSGKAERCPLDGTRKDATRPKTRVGVRSVTSRITMTPRRARSR